MSDTPRMDVALRKAQEDCTESYLLTEGLKLERELNAANKTNRLQYELITTAEKRGVDKSKEELNAANESIKRLEEALTWYESTVSDCNRHGPQGDAARHALAQDRGSKAKEAKP